MEGFLPGSGHVIAPEEAYGPAAKPGQKKVILWSRAPWTEIDRHGSAGLPPGRFVRGVTETVIGLVDVIGVCVPYHMANVSFGRRDRRPWEDHLAYLGGLQDIVAQSLSPLPTILLGDFNQRVPRMGAPERVQNALLNTLGDLLSVGTAGRLPGLDEQHVDHLAHSPDLTVCGLLGLPRIDAAGLELCDHPGVFVELARTDRA